MGVYIGAIKDDYSATQGPCPDGFHVPLGNELNGLVNVATSLGLNASQFSQYFKLPLSGYINRTGGAIAARGAFGYIRSSSASYSDRANAVEIFSTSSYRVTTSIKSIAYSIRPFKNTSLSPDGSWAKLYQGAGNSGIYWNSSLGLITASSDGTTWITISDKNLGATAVYNSGDALSDNNCGVSYQRGNNYGFQGTGPSITSSTKVDASNYGPGNYYNSSTFITVSASPYDWSSVQNDNLWGAVTGLKPTSLKNAYIGEVWTPGENTLAYYPFTDNQLDVTGKTTLPISGTLQPIGCRFSVSGSPNYQISVSEQPNFFSFWLKVNSFGSQGNIGGIWNNKYGIQYYINHNNGTWVNKIVVRGANNTLVNGPSNISQWNYICFGGDGNNYIVGVNGNITNITDTPQSITSQMFQLVSTYMSAADFDISEMIVENTARTSDKIQAYYNSTKSTYGL